MKNKSDSNEYNFILQHPLHSSPRPNTWIWTHQDTTATCTWPVPLIPTGGARALPQESGEPNVSAHDQLQSSKALCSLQIRPVLAESLDPFENREFYLTLTISQSRMTDQYGFRSRIYRDICYLALGTAINKSFISVWLVCKMAQAKAKTARHIKHNYIIQIIYETQNLQHACFTPQNPQIKICSLWHSKVCRMLQLDTYHYP